jgi:hypothetical protein
MISDHEVGFHFKRNDANKAGNSWKRVSGEFMKCQGMKVGDDALRVECAFAKPQCGSFSSHTTRWRSLNNEADCNSNHLNGTSYDGFKTN